LVKASLNTLKHYGIEHAGYMAFLSLLSLFPFFVFITAMAGSLGNSEIGKMVLNYILSSLPYDVSLGIKPRIIEIIQGPPQSILTLAILGTIWTSSSSVEGLRTILNIAYRVKSTPSYFYRRLLSIAQFLVLVLIIMATTFILIILPIIWSKLSYLDIILQRIIKITYFINLIEPYYNHFRYVFAGVILFFVVGILYYTLPNKKLSLNEVLPGSLVVVVLWFAAGIGLSTYLTYFKQVSMIYGSLQGIIITILFFYVMNIIFIFGAEFNYLISLKIKKNARILDEKEI
jgi:membrane protein